MLHQKFPFSIHIPCLPYPLIAPRAVTTDISPACCWEMSKFNGQPPLRRSKENKNVVTVLVSSVLTAHCATLMLSYVHANEVS